MEEEERGYVLFSVCRQVTASDGVIEQRIFEVTGETTMTEIWHRLRGSGQSTAHVTLLCPEEPQP